MNFASDNGAGATPAILAAIAAASQGAAAAYGADPWSGRATARLADVFETELAAFLVATGTAANALALSALARPWEAVFCHEESHVHDDECGAPEFFAGGAKLVGIPGYDGKITPDALRETLARFPRGLVKSCQPAALTLSQATEAGTIYSLDEIRALTEIAHAQGLAVHMDGARFANALVAAQCSPAEMSWRAGIDALSFGATKNGALACEAVIFFDKRRAESFPFLRKRGGHTLSKGRLLGAQMEAYLAADHWLDLAARANAAARRLFDGLTAIPGVRAGWPVEINEVFVIAPTARIADWRAAGAVFYDWPTRAVPPERTPGPGETLIRLVTSFETSGAEIDAFLALARGRA
ncbi:MAG: low specificity L-threonine aldolase [Pseudomonadota bacterium]|nr:low specificity L-threonine aldolase [Pseudomonadota bacterium]